MEILKSSSWLALNLCPSLPASFSIQHLSCLHASKVGLGSVEAKAKAAARLMCGSAAAAFEVCAMYASGEAAAAGTCFGVLFK